MIELLLAILLAITGIGRTVDPGLTEIAQIRAIETSTDATFNHDGRRGDTYEILAWQSFHDTLPTPEDHARRAAEQWQGSPTHWAILTNPSLTRIGCAAHKAEDRWNFACVLLPAPERNYTYPNVPHIDTSVWTQQTATAGDAPIILPDTAMRAP